MTISRLRLQCISDTVVWQALRLMLALVCYAGGHLQLVSMPGYGIDAYLNLKRLEGDWHEDQAEPAEPLLIKEDNNRDQQR